MSILLKSFKYDIDYFQIYDIFPCCIDLDLEQICDIKRINISGNIDSAYCLYNLYGSNDGISFFHFYPEITGSLSMATNQTTDPQVLNGNKFRYLRLHILDSAFPLAELIREVQVFGIFMQEKGCDVKWMTSPIPFSETSYATPVTGEETESYLYGLVERTVGASYKHWFSFHLSEQAGNDQFVICAGQGTESGTVCIIGNTGVALAVGLNYYYKNFCNVHISEQENQQKMPSQIILPETRIQKTAVDSLRYAYNYCTHSYSMPFWGEEEWQKELDWLALNGVNLVLDFTGIEAVWYQFLKELNYTDQEIRSWIVGPCYTAWQCMQNIEGFGGPVHPSFIRDRVELARCNQRKMRILGMHPILQNYAGMVPSFHKLHDPEATVYPQGTWNGIKRPSMLDPTTFKYHVYARRFYEIQAQIYGTGSHYYAVDPFHEGGVRPGNLTDDKIAFHVMEELLSFDPQAIWIIQAWRENPTDLFLEGVKDYRQTHMLVLDLSATDNPVHTNNEFQGTPWIYCMLDMYGGRLSTHGELDVLAEQIPNIRSNTQYMRGIGFTSEATRHNPVTYELLFEMAWEDVHVDLLSWIKSYAQRRYGFLASPILEGWQQLLKTAYHNPGYSHHGGYSQIFTYRPRMTMTRGQEFNELNSSVIKNPYYEPKEFYMAVRSFCDVYDVYRDNACYIYDLQDLLRQILNLLGTESAFNILNAYCSRDIMQFDKASAAFLSLLDICNDLMQIREDTLLGNWVGSAIDCGKQYDDFSKDLFLLNAKALITTWGFKETYIQLADYAYRQYGGLLENYYKRRWQIWINHLREALAEGKDAEEISLDTWFQIDWSFVINTQAEYSRMTTNPNCVLKKTIDAVKSLAAEIWNL